MTYEVSNFLGTVSVLCDTSEQAIDLYHAVAVTKFCREFYHVAEIKEVDGITQKRIIAGGTFRLEKLRIMMTKPHFNQILAALDAEVEIVGVLCNANAQAVFNSTLARLGLDLTIGHKPAGNHRSMIVDLVTMVDEYFELVH